MVRRSHAVWGALALSTALFSCEGSLGGGTLALPSAPGEGTPDGRPDPERDPDPDRSMPPEASACDLGPGPIGEAPMRVVTEYEFNAAARALLGEQAFEAQALPRDGRVGAFALNTRGEVAVPQIEDARIAAERLGAHAAEHAEALLGCDASESACVERFAARLGQGAFRRPLEPEELAQIVELFELGAAQGGASGGVEYVVSAVFQAPSFLYMHEASGAEDRPLSGIEIAHRMATLLWRALPDDELLRAGAMGQLETIEGREAEARRMLDDPRAHRALRELVRQWFALDRFRPSDLIEADGAPLSEERAATLHRLMLAETDRLIDRVMTKGSGSYEAFLTDPVSWVDVELAEHYGAEGAEPDEKGLVRLERPKRSGILGHASFLSAQHGPIHRGLFVRKALLCDIVPGPNGIDTNAIETFPGEAERSKAEKRLEHPSCGGCHAAMDPIGLTMDVYDSLGRARSEDKHGNAVRADGALRATEDIDGPVDDLGQLVESLAGSRDLAHCVGEHVYTYSFGREPGQADACALEAIGHSLETTGDLREALIGVIKTEAFVTLEGAEQ